MSKDWFDANKSFLELKIVKVTLGGILTVSVFLAVLIALNSDLVWDPSGSGFNYALNIFKFPLGVAALLIPIMAMYAATHRSEQTKKQIEVTTEQNRFANYYKHKEEFVKFMSQHSPKMKQAEVFKCHKRFFGGAGDFTTHVLSSVKTDFSEVYLLVEEYYEKLKSMTSKNDALYLLNETDKRVRAFSSKYVNPLSLGYHTSKEGVDLELFHSSFGSPFLALNRAHEHILSILNFDDEFEEFEESGIMRRAAIEICGYDQIDVGLPIKHKRLREFNTRYKVENF